MDIFNLINMKKDMLLGNYTYVDESYKDESYIYEENYINMISENFDLALENANLQLFQCGSDEYIYNLLEENEYWDITEEGVISSIGEGIKKIINSILSLIKKIGTFISNMFKKIIGIFDKGSSEMDKVDKSIKEYNDSINNGNDIQKEKGNKYIEPETVKKSREKYESNMKKENKPIKVPYKEDKELKEKLAWADKVFKENNEKEKAQHNERKRKSKEYRERNENKIAQAHQKNAKYGHNMNAKFDYSLGPNQSLDSLYNKFAKDIKVKSALYKIPDKQAYEHNNVCLMNTGALAVSVMGAKPKGSYEGYKKRVLNDFKCNSIEEVKKAAIKNAYAAFIKNYQDENPFARVTKISEVPLQVIKWYAYNGDEMKKQLSKLDEEYKKELKEQEADLKRLQNFYGGEKYEREYNSLKAADDTKRYLTKNDKDNYKSDTKLPPEEAKKLLTLSRTLLNDFAVFHKTYTQSATYAHIHCVNMCKMLRNKLYATSIDD